MTAAARRQYSQHKTDELANDQRHQQVRSALVAFAPGSRRVKVGTRAMIFAAVFCSVTAPALAEAHQARVTVMAAQDAGDSAGIPGTSCSLQFRVGS
jgi:hypothetical protein